MIGAGVKRLNVIAKDMQQELKIQDVMIDETITKVDATTAHLQQLNKKVKDALEKVSPPPPFALMPNRLGVRSASLSTSSCWWSCSALRGTFTRSSATDSSSNLYF